MTNITDLQSRLCTSFREARRRFTAPRRRARLLALFEYRYVWRQIKNRS